MTRHSLTLCVILALGLTSMVLAQPPAPERTFNGTYLCISCDLKKVKGTNSQCENFGHRHGLKLDGGTYIYFLENDHSVDIIKGGGRESFPMQVTGVYDRRSHTLDVHRYTIDGVETMWCSEHNRMDLCGSHKKMLPKDKAEPLTKK